MPSLKDENFRLTREVLKLRAENERLLGLLKQIHALSGDETHTK